MKNRTPGSLALLLLVALLAAGPPAASQPETEAQGQTGDLVCNVIDTSGNPVAGVTVTVAGIGAPQVQLSSSEGSARFLGLAPGTYKLTADLEGFASVEYPTVSVIGGRTTEFEVVMKPAAAGTPPAASR